MKKILRTFNSISVRLQCAAIFLSLVGLGFGVKSYLHVRSAFGEEASQVFLNDLYIQFGIAILVNLAVAWFIHITAVKPINVLNEIMRQLAAGKEVEKIPYVEARTQIGSTARKVELFQRDVRRIKQMQADQEKERQQADLDRKAFLDNLSLQFNEAVIGISHRLERAAHEMHERSKAMVENLDTSNNHIQELSHSSTQTTESIEKVAHSTDELSTAIQHITERSRSGSTKAGEAFDEASKAGARVSNLAEGAHKIGDVVGLIKEIAEQINLLALNATIEAARAGEAGKGFAVVASEVQSLANQTGSATKEISQQIASIQQETESAVSFIKNITEAIAEINAVSSEISSSVEQQGTATHEIARTMQEVSSYAGKVSDASLSTRDVMQSSHDVSYQVMDQCERMVKECQKLNEQVEGFVRKVKTS